jgi:tetratricopeptide (TPR) repeat protein
MIRSLLILGGIHFTEGHYYEMIATLNDVYNLTRRFSVYPESLTALSNLSLAYRNLADYGHSLRVINQANRMIREENIDEVGSFFFVKPTELFAILGRATQRQFFAYAKTTLREATKKKNLIGLGHYHMCFANYHMNHLRLKNAILAADKALASFGRAEDRDDMVLALTQRAIVGVLRAEFKEAAAALEQATDIYDKIHCEYLRPFLLLAKGMLARSTNAEDARSVLTEALRTSKRIGTREITWQIQRELALFYQGRGEPNKALAHYKDAVETIKEITETIDDERLKISYLEVPFRKRVFDEIKEIKKQLREST